MLLDLAQGGYLDLQRIDPFQCEAHSVAHELSHPATLLEQQLQPALSPSVRQECGQFAGGATRLAAARPCIGFLISSLACANLPPEGK